jgi:hypothetical protein
MRIEVVWWAHSTSTAAPMHVHLVYVRQGVPMRQHHPTHPTLSRDSSHIGAPYICSKLDHTVTPHVWQRAIVRRGPYIHTNGATVCFQGFATHVVSCMCAELDHTSDMPHTHVGTWCLDGAAFPNVVVSNMSSRLDHTLAPHNVHQDCSWCVVAVLSSHN